MAAGFEQLDLTTTWVGIVSLIIFVVGYYFIAAEDKYNINKAKPALFAGTLIFILIGVYYALNGLDGKHLHHEIEILLCCKFNETDIFLTESGQFYVNGRDIDALVALDLAVIFDKTG